MNEQALKDAMQTGCEFGRFSSETLVEDTIRYSITEAQRVRGQGSGDESMLSTAVRKVAEVILRDYPTLTDKEFTLILEAGISGEYGKDTWVSGAMVLQWLKCYMRDQSRIKVIEDADAEQQKSKRKTKEEIDALNAEACETKIHAAFEYYKEKRDLFGSDERAFHIPQFAAVVYNWFRDKGKIPEPTDEQLKRASDYADVKVTESRTRKVFIKSAFEDWRDCSLLMQYFDSIINGK
jgi:hypothetical protein